MSKISYGILASGGLGALCTEKLLQLNKVNFVLTDKGSDKIIELCKTKKIPMFIGNPRNGKTNDFLNQFSTDIILSINYLFIVEEDIIRHPNKYAINFHGSLLPKYRGRTPHVWAIINNETETGITAHLMSKDCDEGDIVYQEKILIGEESTGAEILSKFNSKYPLIIEKIVSLIENDTIRTIKQDHTKATYFGKRTPEDGLINWNWQKERINNWVRAQADPYPGAFTFYKGEKVIIHKIKYSNKGFNYNDPNGTILEIKNEIIIKTSNGAISLINYRKPDDLHFKIGDKLS